MPAANALGSLLVTLGLDTTDYTSGLTKAEYQAGKALEGIRKQAVRLGAFFGTAIGATAFKSLITGSIDAADRLNDLSKQTGISVGTLGGIGFAATQAGGDLESASAAAGKLNKSLAGAAAGNKEAAEAFKVLGISVKDAAGNTISADQALVKIANRFAAAEDGPEKAALALRLFGKAGADMIPLLNEGGAALQQQIAYFERYSGVTAESARAADQFNDTVAKLNLINQSFGQLLAAQLLPTLQGLADQFLKAKENGETASRVVDALSTAFNGLVLAGGAVSYVIGQLGDVIGGVSAAAVAAFSGEFSRAGAILSDMSAQSAIAAERFDAFTKSVGRSADETKRLAQTAADFQRRDKDTSPGAKPRLGRLAGTGSGRGDDASRRLLENELRRSQALIQQEEDLLQSRNRFLELFNSQGLLSVAQYYDARRNIIQDATAAELAELDKQKAAAERFRDGPNRTAKERADAEGKIADVLAKRAKVEREAGEQSIELSIRQQQAQEDLRKAFVDVTAQVDELQERFASAAGKRFDSQFDALRKVFTAEGNQAGLEAIDVLRGAAIAQAEFQTSALASTRTLDELSRQEERLALAQQTGATTSIEALVRLGEIRRAQIPVLEAQVAAQEAIARASGSPQLIANADQARLALERLKATADPLATQINNIFQGAAESAIGDFLTGTKTAEQAFKSFSNSVINELIRMGSKAASEQLFGGSGGAGGFFSNLFSSGSSSSSTGAASSAGSWLSAIGSLFGGFFAGGGYLAPGKVGIVGERGPELAFGGRTGQTIQPTAAGGGRVYNINVSPPPAAAGQSQATTMQQGRDFGVGIRQALARND